MVAHLHLFVMPFGEHHAFAYETRWPRVESRLTNGYFRCSSYDRRGSFGISSIFWAIRTTQRPTSGSGKMASAL